MADWQASKKILVIGGGVTSAVISTQLKRSFKLAVWDKARGCGGRASTTRFTANGHECSMDLGAQYLTRHPASPPSIKNVFTDLMAAQLIRPITDDRFVGLRSSGDNFVFVRGASSLAKYWFDQTQADVKFGRKVTSIQLDESNPEMLRVKAEDGVRETFRHVVCTMPLPQLYELADVEEPIEVKFSSRYALGLVYWSDVPVRQILFGHSTTAARYFDDNNVIRYVAVDGLRDDQSDCHTVTIHTTQEFGSAHIDDQLSDVQQAILNAIHLRFDDLPPADEIKCHRWRYSQPVSGDVSPFKSLGHMDLRPVRGRLFKVQSASDTDISGGPRLIVAGDAFSDLSAGSITGAIHSAHCVAKMLNDLDCIPTTHS